MNSHFSVMKNDFQQSFNRLENQFIAQFSEYKELKQSVEDAKKELDLAGKIKLTYESYHKIVQQFLLIVLSLIQKINYFYYFSSVFYLINF